MPTMILGCSIFYSIHRQFSIKCLRVYAEYLGCFSLLSVHISKNVHDMFFFDVLEFPAGSLVTGGQIERQVIGFNSIIL